MFAGGRCPGRFAEAESSREVSRSLQDEPTRRGNWPCDGVIYQIWTRRNMRCSDDPSADIGSASAAAAAAAAAATTTTTTTTTTAAATTATTATKAAAAAAAAAAHQIRSDTYNSERVSNISAAYTASTSTPSITVEQVKEYNPKQSLGETLSAGHALCCIPGQLPDMRPKPRPDGIAIPVASETAMRAPGTMGNESWRDAVCVFQKRIEVLDW
ncbi:hypothetical protein BT63DRAFT_290937 [Microthyrium microscopicum]|uniref:Uncharacterized protein n=1 Tax=Microthyrium microscopicum TaxID=703497 RepID=A0A6A6U6V4_9PEZI|nr:hypothetical protein BT63DRAFT_290937 [Microthyrium microscopicum]